MGKEKKQAEVVTTSFRSVSSKKKLEGWAEGGNNMHRLAGEQALDDPYIYNSSYNNGGIRAALGWQQVFLWSTFPSQFQLILEHFWHVEFFLLLPTFVYSQVVISLS